MKTSKVRNREIRTKANPIEANVAVRIRIPRDSYDQMRALLKNRQTTKEGIFLKGLQSFQ